MISKDEVKKIADLALLSVDDAELEKLTGEMGAILDYISEINSFTEEDAEAVKPELYNVFRDDEVTNKKGEYTERILAEVPVRDKNYVRVKKIL